MRSIRIGEAPTRAFEITSLSMGGFRLWLFGGSRKNSKNVTQCHQGLEPLGYDQR